ncbi:B-cell lymphoma/leukemia 11B-like [Trichomycterus rosablanca]|uniref:B-cell lymphoma/leukemia 11B-like n=1 Tax=Trichomycterus rosablanca TaxID=2290929 RepID=UPI002F357F85
MSRRKQGNPQHLSVSQRESVQPEDSHDMRAEPRSVQACPLSPVAGAGERDLLTCGQCQTNFPLSEILAFIEHKRRLCRGAGPCHEKPRGSGSGASTSPNRPRVEIARRARPVEIGIQVTPGEEEEKRLTPARGICPKQESVLTGKEVGEGF